MCNACEHTRHNRKSPHVRVAVVTAWVRAVSLTSRARSSPFTATALTTSRSRSSALSRSLSRALSSICAAVSSLDIRALNPVRISACQPHAANDVAKAKATAPNSMFTCPFASDLARASCCIVVGVCSEIKRTKGIQPSPNHLSSAHAETVV